MNVIVRVMSDIMRLVFPYNCEACGIELVGNEELICIQCWRFLPKTNYHLQPNNPIEIRFWGRIPIQHGAAIYFFNRDSRVQTLLHGLKYKNKPEIGLQIGRKYVTDLLISSWIQEIDLIIPVPLSEKKKKIRGYNQSEKIALRIGEGLQIPVDISSFIRIKHTKSQTTMTISERMQNVDQAFSVIYPSQLENKHILLIDDVITTGATLETCAREILKVPGTKVSVLTMAYAME